MTSLEYLKNNKQLLLNEWFEWLINTYPETSKKYFRNTNQQFTNPIGYSLYHNLNSVFDSLINQDFNSNKFRNALEEIIKIRILQQPSNLKEINIFEFLWNKIISTLPPHLAKEDIVATIELFNSFNYIFFEIYSKIQTRIVEIQKDEIRNRYGKIIERLNKRYSKENNYVDKIDT